MTKSAPRLRTKRKYVEGVIKEPKRYIFPLTGNLVLRPIYFRAVREKKRRDKKIMVRVYKTMYIKHLCTKTDLRNTHQNL